MDEYQRFIKQSDNWQNLRVGRRSHGFRGFIMPKDASGKWVDSIKCSNDNSRRAYVPYTPLTIE